MGRRSLFLFATICIFVRLVAAQTEQAASTVTQQVEKQRHDCQMIDPDIFPAETCAVVLSYMSPADQLGPIAEDGSFLVLSPGADGKMALRTFTLPPKLRSEITLNLTNSTLREIALNAEQEPNGLIAAMAPQGHELWLKLRDVYCYYHPDATYNDWRQNKQKCIAVAHVPDEKTLEDEFSGALVFNVNYHTFLNERTVSRLDSGSGAIRQPTQVNDTKETQPLSESASNNLSAAAPSRSSAQAPVSPACARNLSFAVAEGGQIVTRVPDFAAKWISKNQKKYQNTCFSQSPVQNADNFLLVFGRSSSVFMGLYPTVRTSTSTNTSPVSGSGTVTDNYGGMWYYTYNGTVTTTNTTTEHVDVPYTDTSNTLYLYCYDQAGRLRGHYWRTLTSRSGGDTYNTLGYNLGSALASIHMRERLLKSAVSDIAQGKR